jgi:hypothetical protein
MMLSKISWILFCLVLFDSCGTDSEIRGPIEIYRISTYQIASGTHQIDESSVVTSDMPLIRYADIQAYDATNYFFEISDQARSILLDPSFAQPGIPFAVKAGGKIIYTGYFWWSYSSAFCDWVVADLTFLQADKILQINLGYPGTTDNINIPDRRNDPALLEILRRDGKLK